MIWHQKESERLDGELKAFVALYTQITSVRLNSE